MTTTTAPTTTTTAATTKTGTDSGALGKARLASSFDTFLKLLTSQLKNQDPLSPLDSNQFTQQLVQMTGVEQQIYSNDLLKQLVSNSGSTISQAVSVIGKDVQASVATSGLSGGKANWNYKLDRAAADVSSRSSTPTARLFTPKRRATPRPATTPSPGTARTSQGASCRTAGPIPCGSRRLIRPTQRSHRVFRSRVG